MSLVEQIGLGVYIGLLTGMFTALLVFSLAFVFQYVAGVAFPATMGLMIGLGTAGLQGGMFRLMRDPAMLQSPVIITALLIVMLITNYSQKRATDLAKAIPPKTVLLGGIRRRTISPDVVKQLGRFGQVRVTVTGEVTDIEGYPPLPEEVRTAISTDEWTFPADLPLKELERRLAEQLRADHDLDDVTVSVDSQGKATVSAAPPSGGLSRRVPDDKHATTLETLVPTGTAYGDEVEITVEEESVQGPVEESVEGSVVSVTPPEAKKEEKADDGAKAAQAPVAQTAAGGSGRIAVAVSPADVGHTLGTEVSKFVVEPRGQNREYELISLLRGQGNGFQKFVVESDSAFAGQQLGDLDLRREHGVDVLAVKTLDSWTFAPRGAIRVDAGDELFLTGPADAIDSLRGVTT